MLLFVRRKWGTSTKDAFFAVEREKAERFCRLFDIFYVSLQHYNKLYYTNSY